MRDHDLLHEREAEACAAAGAAALAIVATIVRSSRLLNFMSLVRSAPWTMPGAVKR